MNYGRNEKINDGDDSGIDSGRSICTHAESDQK